MTTIKLTWKHPSSLGLASSLSFRKKFGMTDPRSSIMRKTVSYRRSRLSLQESQSSLKLTSNTMRTQRQPSFLPSITRSPINPSSWHLSFRNFPTSTSPTTRTPAGTSSSQPIKVSLGMAQIKKLLICFFLVTATVSIPT